MLSVLSQCLNANNPGQGLSIQDFTAYGTITYFPAGFDEVKQLTGAVTLKGRGTEQVRFEAALPSGKRSFVTSHGQGSFRETNGRMNRIPEYNAIRAHIPLIPEIILADTLSDATTNLRHENIQLDGRPVSVIYIEPTLDSAKQGRCATCRAEMFHKQVIMDPSTHRVLQIRDKVFSTYDSSRAFDRVYSLENYERLGSLVAPSVIRLSIGSMKIWEIHVDSISLNNGLSEADFDAHF